MKVTVTTLDDKLYNLDVADDLELENFKAFCEVESGIPCAEILLMFNGKPLLDNAKTLKDIGIRDGDMVVLDRRRPVAPPPASAGGGGLQLPDFSKIQLPGSSGASARGAGAGIAGPSRRSQEEDPAWIRDMLKANPEQLAMLKHNNPRLADALDSGNLEEFAKVLKEQQEARAERERQRIRMLTADPFDIEAQRLIAQEIENKNIEHNMELAMEYNPESFGTVVMLYIDVVVNGHHIKAFVDSGAQATIMSAKAAERCNIMRLVDRRWAGIAKGVGTQKIIGRVHMAQVQIGKDFLTTSFSILEDQPMDMLLGLDMLKRHQCIIDLNRNVLVIGSTKTETPFLTEAELPECARLSSQAQNVDEAMKISAKEAEEKQMADAMARSEAETKRLKTDVGGILPTDKFTEENVKQLMGYGFPREKCIEELRTNNGDMTQATAALFAKSLKF